MTTLPSDVIPQKMPARRALAWIRAQRWAIQLEWLELIQSIAQRTHAVDYEALQAKHGKRLERSERVVMRGSIAILPIAGPIFRYANIFTDLSGAEAFELLATDLQTAIDNPAVSQIILEIDSPGGTVNGTSEFAQQVRDAQRIKPVTAFVGGLGASAAYWIAAAAGRIVISDTSMLGSIGVVAGVYIDDDEDFVEVVSTQSPGKRPDVRTSEGRAQIQREVDALAQVFVEKIAAYRDMSAEKVLADFGRGGVLVGRDAITAGMADEMGALEDLIAELGGAASAPTARASMTHSPSAPSEQRSQPKVDKNVSLEERCRAEWAADPELRAEFGCLEEYIAFTRATEGGRVHVVRSGYVKASRP